MAVDRPLAESILPKTKSVHLKIGHPKTLICFVGDFMVNHHQTTICRRIFVGSLFPFCIKQSQIAKSLFIYSLHNWVTPYIQKITQGFENPKQIRCTFNLWLGWLKWGQSRFFHRFDTHGAQSLSEKWTGGVDFEKKMEGLDVSKIIPAFLLEGKWVCLKPVMYWGYE